MNTETSEKKPSIFIAMPCYDSVKINTMLSIFQLIQKLGQAKIEVGINTMKSPLIHQARNYLTMWLSYRADWWRLKPAPRALC